VSGVGVIDRVRKLDGRKLDHKTLEQMRIRGVQAVQEGAHPEDVVRALGLGKRCIYNWLAAFRAGGFAQLKAKRLLGRPMKLNGDQVAWLYRTVAGTTPLQHRFEFALWTIKLVQWLIYDEWKIKFSRSSIHRLMRQLGLSCQRPLERAYEQDPARVQRWKREEFPAIRRLAKEAGAEIWFGDESGVRSDYHAGTTWGVKGTTPVVHKTGQRFKFNLLSVINNLGEMRFMLTEQRVNNGLYLEFLQRLLKGTDKPMFLILDGHPVHRSKAVKAFAASTEGRLRLFYLPGYSPELNPDEQVWNEVKYRRVGRKSPRTKNDLRLLLLSSLHALQRLPKQIQSFFQLPDTRYAACE
jgi:transposase